MIKKGRIAAIAALFIMLLAIMPVEAAISKNFDLGDNFYTVYGGPQIEATLLGDNEYSRGDTITLNLGLMNKGVISGFESERDANTAVDTVLQQSEMKYETQAVTAVGVLATLKSDTPYIKVKSGSQEAGTLQQGKQSAAPTKFTIEISKDAPAGTYPLSLDFAYKYQKNVQVSGDEFDTSTGMVSNQGVGIWYENATQNQTVVVQVKKEPYFEVTNVTGSLYPNEGGMLQVTYKNTGEEPAKDATVRVSASDPFSTTDDQAFLGDLKPGESAVAIFNMDVDETATPKPYSLNSEILYEDADGHDQISDSVKVNTQVLPAEKGIPGYQFGISIAFMALAASFIIFRRKKQA
ncbi:MAG TPA: hypothetical protein VN278_04045 [Methanosarcina sp.]|nr:hypothetical protein [Methanosarcina sp.]